MNQGADQLRLAITAFDDPQEVWSTILALLAKGFAIEQFCLVALAAIMARVGPLERVFGAESSSLRALTEQVEDWPTGGARASDGHRLVATSGSLFRSMLPAPGDGHSTKAHITEEHRSELESQVRRGAIVLIVKASNPAQQWLSTRTLLDQSSHSVKTYEFAVQSGAGQSRDC